MNLIFFYTSLLFFLILASINTRLGIYIILIFLPTYLLRVQIWLIPTTWLELTIYLLFFAVVVKLIWQKKLIVSLKHLYHKYSIVLLSLGLWFLAALVATFVSPDLKLSAGVLKGWWLDPIILILIILLNIKNRQQIEKTILALLLGSALVSLYGLIEHIFGFGLQADGLLNAMYKPANYVAMLIVPVTIMSLGLLFYYKNNYRYKYLTIFLIAISLVALFYTKSYGGFLGFSLGVFTLLFWQENKRKKIISIILFIILGLSGVSILSTQAKFKNIINFTERNSLTTRLQIWEISTEVLKNNLIFGVGLGNFQKPYRKMAFTMYQPPLEWDVVKAHNLFLNTLLEMGIIGLSVLLYLLIVFLWQTKKLIRLVKTTNYWWLVAGTFAAMISILSHGLLDTPFFKNDLAILFLVVFILPFIIYKDIKQK